ncbi:MAG: metallophosphoesterase [Candidatus Hydrothermarchaeota archaeon]|nr:metallophosphoesterase [Candidatus Hydrothermarchaeota archaeon]
MLLVHISDLHFGSRFNSKVFDKAGEEINSLKPEVIVVTGDITDEGLLPEFEVAKQRIDEFKCENLVICGGNHDYRNTGYLLLNKFFPLKQVYETKEATIVILKTARPDKDEGEVGYRQTLWLQRQLSRGGKLKIVAMHHHLVPVPDTGLERHTVIDAGDVLAALRKTSVSTVLCGHKHRPWKWDFEDFSIIHAGSLSDARLRGFFHNSYNVINIEKGKIEAKVKVVDGNELSFEELRK